MEKKKYIYPSVDVIRFVTSDLLAFTDASFETPKEPAPTKRTPAY